ncbi:MAG: hypothetical protein U0X73_13515 [Thermoanaerobaculia bacterium]
MRSAPLRPPLVRTLLLSLPLAFTLGCFVPVRGEADLEVGGPPPPLQHEVAPARPGPDFVWVGGHWNWVAERHDYVWVGGSWLRPPHARATWIAPRWHRRHGHWFFVAGRWSG